MNTSRKVALIGMIAVGIAACTTRRTTEWTVPSLSASERERLLSQQNVDAVIYQHSSAEVYRLYQQCYELAAMRLEQNLARPHDKPAAVIVDIDETVLDNSKFQMENIGQGVIYKADRWKHWTDRAAAPALPGAVEFLNGAVAKGCEVFYISNRSLAEQDSTMKNLKNVGFPMVDGAHMLCMENGISDKTERRKRVSDGYYIALLVGDQLRDFDERFKDRQVGFMNDMVDNKGVLQQRLPEQLYGRPLVNTMHDTLERYFIMLPNPMYGTWLDVVTGKVDSMKIGAKNLFFPQYDGR